MAREGWRAAAIAAVIACMCAPAAASADPVATTRDDVRIVMDDGKTLAASVFRPATLGAGERSPAIVDASPYYGAGAGGLSTTYWLDQWVAKAGYTLVSVSLRGFGDSDGCVDVFGARDRADMGAVVDWVLDQSWSDGGLAVAGFSYDAAAALAAVVARPDAVDAAVLMNPALYHQAFYANGVRYSAPYNVAAYGPLISAFDLVGPAPGSAPDRHARSFADADPACWANHVAGLQSPDGGSAYWRERDLLALVAGSRVPVFVGGGFEDWAVKPSAAPALLEAFRGPERAVLAQTGHVPVNDEDVFPEDALIGRAGFSDDVRAFLDEHVRAREETQERPRVVVQEGTGGWRSERRWPPRDVRTVAWDIRAGSVGAGPGNWADRRTHVDYPAGTPGEESPRQGAGSWTVSQPLERALHIAGAASVHVQATAPAAAGELVALLYDVAPDGTATVITRGARLASTGALQLRMLPQDWRVARGHRIGLLLSTADHSLYLTTAGAPVTVAGGTLVLPYLGRARRDDLSGGAGPAIRARRPFVVDEATIEHAEVRQPEPRVKPAKRRRRSR